MKSPQQEPHGSPDYDLETECAPRKASRQPLLSRVPVRSEWIHLADLASDHLQQRKDKKDELDEQPRRPGQFAQAC